MRTIDALGITIVMLWLVNGATAGWVTSGNNMYSDVSGSVGIGTIAPQNSLHVVGKSPGDGIWLSAPPGGKTDVALLNNMAQYALNGLTQAGDSMILFKSQSQVDDPSAGGLVLGPWTSEAAGIRITPTGRLGVGTASPQKVFHVVGKSSGDGIWLSSSPEGKTDVALLNDMGSGGYNGLTQAGDSMLLLFRSRIDDPGAGGLVLGPWSRGATGIRIAPTGKVGIGTPNPSDELTIRGRVLLQSKSTGANVLELGEGLDYAEGFEVTNMEEAGPGTVLVIDPDNAGKLTVSTTPYDTKVAGIVAGAKGLGSGVRLGSGQFDQNVALAGRVYCNVDATETAVQPGDLLTTSATVGYAMKASDPGRAYGAILGKAMESLPQGKKGQILVLVTLQ